MLIPREKPMPALLEFVAAWVPDLSPTHRIDQSLIPAFIPPPLRDIYELAGNWPIPFKEQWRPPKWVPGLFGTQDQLLPLDQLKVNGNRFTFIHENQGVWSCETIIDETDPPVFSDAVDINRSDGGMREVCPTLSQFLTTFCLQELAFGSQNLFCATTEPENPSELVKGVTDSLWLDGMYAYKGLKYAFYLCDNKVLIMRTGMEMPGNYWLAFNKTDASTLLSKRHELQRIH